MADEWRPTGTQQQQQQQQRAQQQLQLLQPWGVAPGAGGDDAAADGTVGACTPLMPGGAATVGMESTVVFEACWRRFQQRHGSVGVTFFGGKCAGEAGLVLSVLSLSQTAQLFWRHPL